jgi:processive 1,2-diacylglycerol beta-glucosyltransferase
MNAIPVLSAGFGEGHNAAARAVVAAINRLHGSELRAEFRDLFLDAYGETRFRRQRELYLSMANRSPRLWGLAYHALDRLPVVRMSLPFLGPVAHQFRKALVETRAPVIVSTYPLYPHFLRRIWAPHASGRPRLITVVTDSISVNRAWHGAHSDWYVAPNPATAAVMVRQGVPAERVLSLGFPVSDRLRAGRQAGEGARPRVLLMLNPGRRDAVALARSVSALDIDLTVTVGKDADFHSQVARAVDGRAVVIGWTDRLPELILESDLVLTKAGGATTHECVAAGVPMVFTQVIPGQEAGNARLVVEGGAGAYGLNPEEACAAVRHAFADQRAVWRGWRAAMPALGDPLGADRVADLVLREAQDFRASVSEIRWAS